MEAETEAYPAKQPKDIYFILNSYSRRSTGLHWDRGERLRIGGKRRQPFVHLCAWQCKETDGA